jgi:hypothetical protein
MMKNSCNHPTLPCLLLGIYSSIMTQVVVITDVGFNWLEVIIMVLYVCNHYSPHHPQQNYQEKKTIFQDGFPLEF